MLVEDQPGTAETLAAYIDLNALRSGLVTDPKDHRFCGYAEALAGNKAIQAGLMSFQKAKEWKQAGTEYRKRMPDAGWRPGRARLCRALTSLHRGQSSETVTAESGKRFGRR